MKDFELRAAQSGVFFEVKREQEMQEGNEQKLPKVLPGYSGGRLLGRSTKVKGREEGEEDWNSGARRNRNEIAHKVVTEIMGKTGAHEEAKATAQRIAGKVSREAWIVHKLNMKKREEEELWQKENQMEMQWAQDEKQEGRNEVPCRRNSYTKHLS